MQERTPLAYACELDRIDAAVLLLESGADEESFHQLPPVWKREYVRNWLEERSQSQTMRHTAGDDTAIGVLDERVAQGLIGIQVYAKYENSDEVGMVVGHSYDDSGALMHEVEFEENGEAASKHMSMSYLEVISGHAAYFAKFGSGPSFVPLVAFRTRAICDTIKTQDNVETTADTDAFFDASGN